MMGANHNAPSQAMAAPSAVVAVTGLNPAAERQRIFRSASAPGCVLCRSSNDRMLFGVSGGIATYLDMDPGVILLRSSGSAKSSEE